MEAESARLRDRYVGCGRYAQQEGRRGWRNGFYFRDFVSRFGTLRLQLTRPRERDLPEVLSFFSFPRHVWRKLRTTNLLERCFVEVRRRTRPMVCFVNLQRVDRITYAISNRFNHQWRNRTLRIFTQAA